MEIEQRFFQKRELLGKVDFALERIRLAQEVEEFRKAGIKKTELATYYSLGMRKIADDELDARSTAALNYAKAASAQASAAASAAAKELREKSDKSADKAKEARAEALTPQNEARQRARSERQRQREERVLERRAAAADRADRSGLASGVSSREREAQAYIRRRNEAQQAAKAADGAAATAAKALATVTEILEKITKMMIPARAA
jgi:colicin import membrane protein